MSRPLLTLLRRLLLIVILLGLGYLARPWVERAVYALRLSSMPVPTALAMPVSGLGKRDIRDTWNAPRGATRRHEGIDIFAKRGTPVVSTTEGIVLRIEETPVGGKVVWVMGPGGQHHYYAHLDGFGDLTLGDRVRAGTLLGFVGNTGNAAGTPPHLHYGIYGGDGAINPYPLLAGVSPDARTGRSATD